MTKPRSDRFDTMTQSLISIEDTVGAPAELLEDFERFTDDLVDGVIANKQISQIAIPFVEPKRIGSDSKEENEKVQDDNRKSLILRKVHNCIYYYILLEKKQQKI